MSEKTVTWDEARRCPRCEEVGVPGRQKPVPGRRGYTTITLTCQNERCRWYQTGWTVQKNPDGSIPVTDHRDRTPKQFPRDPGVNWNQIQQRLHAEMEATERASRSGGAELT